MNNAPFPHNHKTARVCTPIGIALFHRPSRRSPKSERFHTAGTFEDKGQSQLLPFKQRSQVTYNAYILGPGDGLDIELVDLPELSGQFSIGPDGTLYLPRLRALYVEGLTVDELQAFLTDQFRAYVIDPQVYVRPIAYRPIRVYVGGEVKRPGYYTLSGNQNLGINTNENQEHLTRHTTHTTQPLLTDELQSRQKQQLNRSSFTVFQQSLMQFNLTGITPYSDLSKFR